MTAPAHPPAPAPGPENHPRRPVPTDSRRTGETRTAPRQPSTGPGTAAPSWAPAHLTGSDHPHRPVPTDPHPNGEATRADPRPAPAGPEAAALLKAPAHLADPDQPRRLTPTDSYPDGETRTDTRQASARPEVGDVCEATRGGGSAAAWPGEGGGPGVAAAARRSGTAGAVGRRGARGRRHGPGAGALVATDCAAGLIGLREVGPDGPLLPVVLLGVLLAVHRRTGLYRPALAPAAVDEVPRIALGAVLGWGMAAAAVAAAGPGSALGWAELAGAAGLTSVAALAGRALVYRLRGWLSRRAPEPALVVGAGPAAHQIAAVLRAHPEYGLLPVAVTGSASAGLVARQAAPDRDTSSTFSAFSAFSTSSAFPAPFGATGPPPAAAPIRSVRHAVIVGPPAEDVVRMLADRGCRVWRVGGDGRAQHLWGHGFALVERAAHTRRLGKRAMDVAVAAAVLVPLAPLLGCCALAVRLTDGPGVLFKQERIGLDGRPFTLLKFRTMRPRDESESATRWNIAHDHRISPVGRVLRRTSLDELPQLWNVLRGDMSLVGPRPERPHFVERFAAAHPGYRDRHRMPAGVTGLAQVHGLRGDTSIADRARFDNHYIDTWSLWQDVAILFRTIRAVLRLGGS